jgi:NAD(P)H-dependent FMN reductase
MREMDAGKIRLLAISGSLRAVSFNTALLRAAIQLAPDDVEIILYTDIASLPFFNPDLEGKEPAPVLNFLKQIRSADGILIASPEYAHGVTGVLKNALDWLVSGEEFVGKPVALFNTSPRANHAYAALKETITVMSARIVNEASICVALLGTQLDAAGIVAHPEISRAVRKSIVDFTHAIKVSETLSQAED